jgi:hypothetical protein
MADCKYICSYERIICVVMKTLSKLAFIQTDNETIQLCCHDSNVSDAQTEAMHGRAKTTTEEEPMREVERCDEPNDETHRSTDAGGLQVESLLFLHRRSSGTPQSPLLPAKSSATNLWREAAMGPDSSLPERSSDFNRARSPICSGMLPVSLLYRRLRIVRNGRCEGFHWSCCCWSGPGT